MPTSGTVATMISRVEGFDVSFVDDAGEIVDDARLAPYPYNRAARNSWTVTQWRQKRIETAYLDLWLVAWRPDGEEAHGNTRLETLRRLYDDDGALYSNGDRDEIDIDDGTASSANADGGDGKSVATEAATATGGDLAEIERTLWAAADKLRGSMDAAEYKHVVLGLIFLKYVSDAFLEVRTQLEDEIDDGADPDDVDEYRWRNVFWVPPPARWDRLQSQARQPNIGSIIDRAMDELEALNPVLVGVLPKDYARPALDQQRLGQLIDMMGNITVGDAAARSRDVLGRVYEYFLSMFADAEGKRGGEFYTPRCVVKLLVEMIEPFQGRVYDPCCGSSGMFVQSVEFIEAHATGNGNGGSHPRSTRTDISIYGQESNYTTWRLARMNLAIRGIEGRIEHGDTFLDDRHPDLRADYILANPPFNVSDWGGEQLADDKRWRYGTPPPGNANFAWVQHMAHHLAPRGVAGFVLANGSMSSSQKAEAQIRRGLIEAGLLDAMVALPGQLFYSTAIPACLWFLAKDRSGDERLRARQEEVLFIDARKLGRMVDRTHRELTDDDISRIAGTYHAWRTGDGDSDTRYADVPGYCKSTTLDVLRTHDYVLTPGRYVGIAPQVDDSEPFAEKMTRLATQWRSQQADAAELDAQIEANLRTLGF
ncbi:N-6 DNA methylase [Candidatus Poriferisodalis sp.]|uniref:type I restriction-modification system subunit M n=1 Tax=Candidatus Poriferisodalis sp. TaxID=3101277 RepID=UPI003D0969D7